MGFLDSLTNDSPIHWFLISILGAAAISGAFSEQILKDMAAFNERPIIFALSNPTSKAECTAEQCYKATQVKPKHNWYFNYQILIHYREAQDINGAYNLTFKNYASKIEKKSEQVRREKNYILECCCKNPLLQ